MKYYSEAEARPLRAAFEKEVLTWPKVTSRAMFGCPAYLVDGKLFAFLVTDGVVITQMRPRDREALAQTFSLSPFKAGEREIERWVQVTLDDLDRLPRVLPYVKKSYQTLQMG